MSTPTAQEIYAGLAQQKLALYLYNPSDKVVPGRYNGIDYNLPPAGECFIKVKHGRTVESHDEPGVLPIHGYTCEKSKQPKQGPHSSATPEYVSITPEEIVTHLVGPDGVSGQLGPLGIRRLVGIPELDEVLKKDARATWLLKQYQDDVALTDAHAQVCAAKSAKGEPLPFLTPRVREAMKRRSKYEAGGGADYAKYVCPRCGDRLAEEFDVRAHVEAYHSQHAASVYEKLGIKPLETVASPTIEDDEPVVEKRGPGRPRKAVA